MSREQPYRIILEVAYSFKKSKLHTERYKHK